jgi:hypothetical protein
MLAQVPAPLAELIVDRPDVLRLSRDEESGVGKRPPFIPSLFGSSRMLVANNDRPTIRRRSGSLTTPE